MNSNTPIMIVTGLSGAGLSSVLKNLEDMGFEVFDNFPLSLIKPLLQKSPQQKPIALGIDSRSREFDPAAIVAAAKKHKSKLIFITADTDVLQRRFKETRRRHPLASDKTVTHGIKSERTLFKAIEDAADITIDTSELTVHDLRHILEGHFRPQKQGHMNISLMSFGFRHGTPREADIIWDVRFLKNPNWIKDLKDKTGQDPKVGTYIKKDPGFAPFMKGLKDLLEMTLPRYAEEGKHYLTIAIGCTGGRHRSVYLAEDLSKWLKEKGFHTTIDHRDLP